MCPYAGCSDCCIVLCWSWLLLVVVVVVEYCCCIRYRLVLMLVLTFALSVLTFAPCALTFAPCAYGFILLSTSASTTLAHMVGVTGCNLRRWRFSFSHWRKHSLHRWWCHPLQLALVVFSFHPLAHILHLHSSNTHCVVIYIYIYIYIIIIIIIIIIILSAPCATAH